jgi:hypothetical protein
MVYGNFLSRFNAMINKEVDSIPAFAGTVKPDCENKKIYSDGEYLVAAKNAFKGGNT